MEVSEVETDFSKMPNEKLKKANELCLIAVFAMFGVLMRQGIDMAAQPLEDDFGIPLYTSYFSNFVGCFLIGFFGQIAKSDIKLTPFFIGGSKVQYKIWPRKYFFQTTNFISF